MKIGYFTTFPYNTNGKLDIALSGGVGNVAYNLAREMAKKGHEVYVFASSRDSKDSVEKIDGITVYRYKMNFEIGSAPIALGVLYKPLKLGIDLDIVHSHIGNLPAPLTGYLYAKKYNKPFIITHHNEWIGGYGGVIRRFFVWVYNKIIADRLYSHADKILALSEYQLNESVLLNKYRKNVKVISNGINPKEFETPHTKIECREKLGLPKDKKIILFVGSLVQQKGVYVLLDSIMKVYRKHPDIYLVYLGDGNEKKELQKLAKQRDVDALVKFAGRISDQETKTMFYKSADLFCLPSYREGFGIVVLEAAVFGLPVVVSDLKVFRTIIEDGLSGLFSKTGDSNDLADKINQLFSNNSLATTLGFNVKKKVNEFTWELVTNRTLMVYQEVTDGHN